MPIASSEERCTIIASGRPSGETLAPCSVVLPAPQGAQSWPLIELDYYGIGVVAVDAAGAGSSWSPLTEGPDHARHEGMKRSRAREAYDETTLLTTCSPATPGNGGG